MPIAVKPNLSIFGCVTCTCMDNVMAQIRPILVLSSQFLQFVYLDVSYMSDHHVKFSVRNLFSHWSIWYTSLPFCRNTIVWPLVMFLILLTFQKIQPRDFRGYI